MHPIIIDVLAMHIVFGLWRGVLQSRPSHTSYQATIISRTTLDELSLRNRGHLFHLGCIDSLSRLFSKFQVTLTTPAISKAIGGGSFGTTWALASANTACIVNSTKLRLPLGHTRTPEALPPAYESSLMGYSAHHSQFAKLDDW